MEPGARFEDVKIPLTETVHGLDAVSGVLGIPEWWPTGARVGIVLGHASASHLGNDLFVHLQRELTERKYLTLRFNFPFAEAGKKRADANAVLERTFRSAISILGRDPTAAPAHLILGGHGLGAQVACNVAATQVRVEAMALLGYPLHALGKPEEPKAEPLFRIICPMLFVQGSRDRTCDIPVLKQTMVRIGAPTTLHIVDDADRTFKVPKKSPRTVEDVQHEILTTLDSWIQKTLG